MVKYHLRDLLSPLLSVQGRIAVVITMRDGTKLRRSGDYAHVQAELVKLDETFLPGQVEGVRVSRTAA